MTRTSKLAFLGLLLAVLGGCQSNPQVRVKGGGRYIPAPGLPGRPADIGLPAFKSLLGDYCLTGVRTKDGRTDIPKLITALKLMGARDYFHLVWSGKDYPSSWADFKLMAPEFQKAGIRLWLYLTPPSEPPPPEPFGYDYVRWARECADVAAMYPSVAGLCIDDFNGNVNKFSPAYCREMMRSARAVAPQLALLVTNYFGYFEKTMAEHIRTRAVDGVIFPYFYPHRNHSDTSLLLPQIEHYRRWLDGQTEKGHQMKRMPLIVMIYATRHSQSVDDPSPAYVRRCLEIGLEATERGLADGVVTYCLPKDIPEFTGAAAAVYKLAKDLK
jgi:hypothetical protein